MKEYQELYDSYSYLDKTVAGLPQKNSIPSYVKASHKLVNQMGQAFADTTANLYKENLELSDKIADLAKELSDSRQATADQKGYFENSYETLMALVKTSAVLEFASDYEHMPVYVAGKARYLIGENGADAEFKADKTIKGKILRAEDDSFYFEVGNDKNGERFEVNFESIAPGTPVKILSK
jgi:hypothetical protein